MCSEAAGRHMLRRALAWSAALCALGLGCLAALVGALDTRRVCVGILEATCDGAVLSAANQTVDQAGALTHPGPFHHSGVLRSSLHSGGPTLQVWAWTWKHDAADASKSLMC